MLALHALFLSKKSFFIWGEDSARWQAASAKRTRSSARTTVKAHPFACSADQLCHVLAAATNDIDPRGLSAGNAVLRLPTADRIPAKSPYLLTEEYGPAGDKASLESWSVEGVQCRHVDVTTLLDAFDGFSSHGIVLSESFRYWLSAARLVQEWVARGCVLPVAVEAGGTYHARWMLYAVEDRDFERRHLLAEAMPPVGRAEVAGDNAEPNPLSILDAFLNTATDGLCRRLLADRKPAKRSRAVTGSSAETAFVKALTGENPTIEAAKSDVRRLAGILADWSKGASDVSAGALRTTFRLEAPDEVAQTAAGNSSDGFWQLRFLLQAIGDKSLQIPAEDVWNSRAETARFLRQNFEHPQERLLGDLGRATRLYAPIEEGLNCARPTGLRLTAEQAYDFLRNGAPLLEQAGFGVLVPQWWQKPAHLGVRLKVKGKEDGPSAEGAGSGLLGMNALVEYSWEIAVGEETITPEEFAKLAALKVPLVRIRGQWVELKPDEIEAAIAFFAKRQAMGTITLGDAMHLNSGIEKMAGVSVTKVDVEGWLSSLLGDGGEDGRAETIETPDSFQGELRPYQNRGLSWLAFLGQRGLGACLADDMGLGKTIQLIALLLREREDAAARPQPTLLICPMSVMGNWHREVRRFAPSLEAHIHHGAERLADDEFVREAQTKDLVITSYAVATRDVDTLKLIDWKRVALDEAQNIKNSNTKQSQAIRQLAAGERVALTGTPVENRLSELWSIMEFLNPGYLGGPTEFRKQFIIPIERYHDDSRATALKNLVKPFILRRLKTDRTIIADLPDKIENKVYCNLTREQASLYQAVVDEMLEKVEDSEGITRKGIVLATMLRLKQVCNHPAHFLQDHSSMVGRSGKLERLTEMLEELVETGDKSLVFTQFAEMGRMLKSYLQERFGHEVLFLHGGTTRKARDAMVASFQSTSPSPLIFILSLKAGGVGLNLTGASHVFHFDRWWNPAVENQATDRAFRIGQTKNVQIHKYICVGTLEERIDAMIEQKKELAEKIIGAGEMWLTELSTAELRDLLTLGGDAVSEDG